jgi:hypothetical protein
MAISNADYLAMQARLNKTPSTNSGDGVDDEGELHREVLAECRRQGWLCLHGSMAHRTKRTPGEPDCVVIMPGVVLFVELKAKTGKPSTEQLGIQAWMRRLGFEMHIVRSLSQFMELTRTQQCRTPPAAGAP